MLQLSVSLLKHIVAGPFRRRACASEASVEVRRQLLAFIAGRQENRHPLNEYSGYPFDRFAIEPNVENCAVEVLSMHRSECWLQTPERANDLGAQRKKNVLDLHCYEELILDDQNSAARKRLLHGSILAPIGDGNRLARKREPDSAFHAVRVKLHPRVAAEHIRKATLDRFGAKAATRRQILKRYARLPPHDHKVVGLLAGNRPPAHFQLRAVLAKGSIFARVGGKFVERHPECLHDFRRKATSGPASKTRLP